MTTAGTYYYPPSAGTGNLLLTNPPFIMDTNQPTPADDLRELTEAEFQQISRDAGGASRFDACNYNHARRIAQLAFSKGADRQLLAVVDWVADRMPPGSVTDLFNKTRLKSPTVKERALAILDDCSDRIDAAHENTLRRALEALPD